MNKLRRLKKALKSNFNKMTPDEMNSGISDLYDAMLEKALIQNEIKRKGFGYDIGKSSDSDSRSGEDDGVCSEGEQPSEPGES